MDYKKQSLAAHKKLKGKIALCPKMKVENKNDLSAAYTPGVAAVCELIAKDKKAVMTHTIKANTVAVISDGSAVLGLGNIGPLAALPVMEGKSLLFKKFGGVDAFPICLDTQDIEEIIKAVKLIAPVFGGINLEDISAPRCFEIEEWLKRELNIPVFHDDQHGTAIVTLAALINGLKVVKKDISEVKTVISGAGAAGIAVANIFILAGMQGKNIIMFDTQGALYSGRKNMNPYKEKIAAQTNSEKIKSGLCEALVLADVFIGVSAADILKPEWIEKMADNNIVFAMANPNPEISYTMAKKTKIKIFGTGRSDYPNQINNVLAFPGIFRGVLDVRAPAITEDMKLAAAYALASLVSKKELKPDNIIPKPFDKRVVRAVARAVKKSYYKNNILCVK